MDNLRSGAPLCPGDHTLSSAASPRILVRNAAARHGSGPMFLDAQMPRLVPLLPLWLLAACATLPPPQGDTPYLPTAAMTKVLAERQAMHAKEPARISVSEARDVPSLSDAADTIPTVVGLPPPDIQVAQFNQ